MRSKIQGVGNYSRERGITDYNRCHSLDFLQLFREIGISNGSRVVDLGCGEGRFLEEISEKFPETWFLGVDKARRESSSERLNFVEGDVSRDMPQILSQSVDLVVSTCLSQWLNLEELNRFYSEVNRILKEDGLALIYPICSQRLIGDFDFARMGFQRNFRLRRYQIDEIDAMPQILFGNMAKVDYLFSR